MPAVQGFQLTEDDVEILHRVFDLRVAHIDHLSALTARSQKALSRRLFKLTERRFLARIERRPQKHLYAIGAAGVPVLIEHGYARRDLTAKRLRHSELKEIFLRHLLFVVDIHVKVFRLTQQGPVKLIEWREGPALFDEVTIRVPEGRGVTLPIRPDASFTLVDTRRPTGRDRFHFFLEADRSTMSHARMTQKITGYLNYFQQGLYRRKYPGMKTFGVATITETSARAASLSADLAPILPPASRRAYPFIAFEDLFLASLIPQLLDAHGRAA
jgi:Replication-relaxation